MRALEQHVMNIPTAKRVVVVAPSRFIEYAYYFSIVYGTMGDALGISEIPLLGAGMLAFLAAFCVMRLQSRASIVFTSIAFPLSCALFLLVVQLAIHGESLMHENTRPFVIWILMLIITQSLSLRPGFFHRFALATFVVGLMTLPYLRLDAFDSEFGRAGLTQGVAIGNPNDLAAWFGFCVVYFIITAIEAKRRIVRMASWPIATGCLFIVGLTVSRAALVAAGIAGLVALRRVLRSGFIPLLLLVILSGIAYESGLFERAASSYSTRASEETGRLLVWPLAVARFLSSPLVGFPASEVGTYVPSTGKELTPHNGFLFIALASGILPLTFFVAYWWRAFRGVFRSSIQPTVDAPYHMPLLIFAFLIIQSGNVSFMAPWVIATLSTAISADVPRQARRIRVPRRRNTQIPETFA